MTTEHKLGDEGWAIGSVPMSGRALLAPLSGVTDVGFRRLARRFGAALVVSEMVASDDYVLGSEEARLRAEGADIDPHVVQLAGCDPRWMSEAARKAEAAGAAILDINMGCPAKRVTGGWAGSALMRDLDHATRLIEAVTGAVAIPVTVKMRLGWDHAALNAPALARRAEAAGARAVTVHGRTRQQFYKGRANWAAIRAVVEAVAIPVVANGDIVSVADAQACLAASGATAVMIGRAAMGQPWLVGAIDAALTGRPGSVPSPADQAEAAVEHYESLLARHGAAVGLRHARKHLAAYADVAAGQGRGLSSVERQALVTSEDPGRVVALLRRLPEPRLAEAA